MMNKKEELPTVDLRWPKAIAQVRTPDQAKRVLQLIEDFEIERTRGADLFKQAKILDAEGREGEVACPNIYELHAEFARVYGEWVGDLFAILTDGKVPKELSE
jgi:hypothetical protein